MARVHAGRLEAQGEPHLAAAHLLAVGDAHAALAVYRRAQTPTNSRNFDHLEKGCREQLSLAGCRASPPLDGHRRHALPPAQLSRMLLVVTLARAGGKFAGCSQACGATAGGSGHGLGATPAKRSGAAGAATRIASQPVVWRTNFYVKPHGDTVILQVHGMPSVAERSCLLGVTSCSSLIRAGECATPQEVHCLWAAQRQAEGAFEAAAAGFLAGDRPALAVGAIARRGDADALLVLSCRLEALRRGHCLAAEPAIASSSSGPVRALAP